MFHVGVDPQPGAVICDPTPSSRRRWTTVYQDIAAGDFAAEFGEIKGRPTRAAELVAGTASAIGGGR